MLYEGIFVYSPSSRLVPWWARCLWWVLWINDQLSQYTNGPRWHLRYITGIKTQFSSSFFLCQIETENTGYLEENIPEQRNNSVKTLWTSETQEAMPSPWVSLCVGREFDWLCRPKHSSLSIYLEDNSNHGEFPPVLFLKSNIILIVLFCFVVSFSLKEKENILWTYWVI